METEEDLVVKEHVVAACPLARRWLALALAAAAALAALAAGADSALPAARRAADTPPTEFSAERAYAHLLNLTSIGARVAGSLENEVLAVGALVGALKEVARGAAPHQRLELDVSTADGAFPLAFLDGMNNVYRGVSAVVARLSARGAPPANPRAPRPALLFNCHYDTVPDSPGASDDGAGCAVLLEVARALAAGPALRHDALFLFNGAEENILQAAHGFTRHAWAGAARAFVNLEACGAGGRELVFQAGPRAARLLDAYAAAAPRPFASSLAQELFRSGMVPADTDFRVFRDHAHLPGLDLAWSADGYVYHTRLDAPARLPSAALQRAGDNVLALAHEVLRGDWLARAGAAEQDEGEPVFFDVLGVWMVTLRPRAAAAAALLVLALQALDLRRAARHARLDLGLRGAGWARAVLGAAGAVLAAGGAGVLAAAGVALPLWALDRRLAYYARPWLLLPLYVLPALAAAAHVLRAGLRAAGVPRGWWRARAVAAGCGALAGAALLACLAAGLRAGYLPALSAAGAALAGLVGGRRTGGARASLAALGLAPGALLACYLGAGTLRVLVPLAGRAGGGADVWLGAATAALTLGGVAWVLPLVAVARSTRAMERGAWAACAAALALVRLQAGNAAYSELAPQRVMVFHTRLTEHARAAAPELRYWVPALDDNTARTLAAAGLAARTPPRAECERRPWCGAPYYLPVRSLVPHWFAADAPEPPLVALAVNISIETEGARRLVRLTLEGAQHAVVLAAPAPGVVLAGAAPLEGAPAPSAAWGARRTHFFLLHDARAPRPLRLELALAARGAAPAGEWCALLVAGHAMFGPRKLAAAHARLLAALPPHTAATGWGADMHLYSV